MTTMTIKKQDNITVRKSRIFVWYKALK